VLSWLLNTLSTSITSESILSGHLLLLSKNEYCDLSGAVLRDEIPSGCNSYDRQLALDTVDTNLCIESKGFTFFFQFLNQL
jgi:hypothetical protein